MANSTLLDSASITKHLGSLPGWALSDDQKQIHKEFRFKDFIEAMAFVNQLVEPAEAMNHHPDLRIVYNRVSISLSTHDAGGLTEKDMELAKAIESKQS